MTSRTPRIAPTRSALDERQPEAAPAREIVGGEEPGLISDVLHRRAFGDHVQGARQIGARCLGASAERDPSEAVSRSFWDQGVRGVDALAGRVNGVERCRRRRARHDRRLGERRWEGDDDAVSATHPRSAREITGEQRPHERDVGDCPSERVGHDCGLDAAGQRRAVAGVISELEPTRVPDGDGEALGPRRIVEVGDRRRPELPGQLARRAPKLGLLGRIAGVHRGRI